MQLELISIARPPKAVAPDAWHLPDFLSLIEQRELLEMARALFLSGHMSQPETGRYNANGEPVKMRVRLGCWGCRWTLHHGYLPPVLPLPDRLAAIAEKAVSASVSRYSGFGPDTCIVQHYFPGDSLGLHVDDSEDQALIEQGSPIVSLSIGDSCYFDLHPLSGGKIRLQLQSGDAFVFGGQARSLIHGVPKILPGTAPIELGMQQGSGRLNFTLRRAKA
jgi:alkylated DNA repair protein (DNA oxidative demethylase)